MLLQPELIGNRTAASPLICAARELENAGNGNRLANP